MFTGPCGIRPLRVLPILVVILLPGCTDSGGSGGQGPPIADYLNGTGWDIDAHEHKLEVIDAGDDLSQWSQVALVAEEPGVRAAWGVRPTRTTGVALPVGEEVPATRLHDGDIENGQTIYFCDSDGAAEETRVGVQDVRPGRRGRFTSLLIDLRPCA